MDDNKKKIAFIINPISGTQGKEHILKWLDEKGLYEYLDNNADGAKVMETIRTTGNLDKDTEEQLKTVLTRYTESFVKAH